MMLVKSNFQFLALEGAKIAPSCTYPFTQDILRQLCYLFFLSLKYRIIFLIVISMINQLIVQ